ncbi:MAG: M48 family metallopeptidase [Verrucomicrobia bacterium]|nr:M48 family metallopeptidase [Verrucomicrobiota bacterium]
MSDATTIATAAGPARLRRSSRRTLAISVLPDGMVDLVAPRDARVPDIVARVSKRLRWIARQRRAFAAMNRNRVPLSYESGATHRYLGKQYRLKVRRADSVSVRLIGSYFQIVAETGRPAEVEDLLNGWLREKAVEQFSARLAKWNDWCRERRLPVPRVRLLRMPKRWGSSHRDGRIYLNPELVKAPSICIDYVIAHEICHLQHPQHNRAFFNLLDQVFPNWRGTKARLEQLQ